MSPAAKHLHYGFQYGASLSRIHQLLSEKFDDWSWRQTAEAAFECYKHQ